MHQSNSNIKFLALQSTALNVATCAGLAMPESTGDAPDWVHILPAGKITTQDGRGPYSLPAAGMEKVLAESLQKAGGKLAVDENHATDLAAKEGRPAPARGWVDKLEARDDGIWAHVTWTQSGLQLMQDSAYRFISPVFLHSKSGEILRFLRIALTNDPNLNALTALNSKEAEMDFLTKLRLELGLKADASETDTMTAVTALQAAAGAAGDSEGGTTALQSVAKVLDVTGDNQADDVVKAVTALQSAVDGINEAAGLDSGAGLDETVSAVKELADPAKHVPASAVKDLQSQITALQQGTAQKDAEALVDKAIADGKAGVKPLRAHYIARCMKDPEGVKKEFDTLPSLTGVLVPSTTPPKDGEVALNAAQQETARQLGISLEAYQKTVAEEAGQQETL